MIGNGIIFEFAAEAAFLWVLRTRAVDEPHFSLDDLAKLDERLEAHLDGLRVAGEAGWAACERNFGSEHPEEYFAPAVLALESGTTTRIHAVLDAIGEDPAKARTLISAFGWLPFEEAEPHISNLLSSRSPFQRYIGIAASAIHRQDPGRPLDQALENNDVRLIARALRAYGELGRELPLNHFRLRNNLSDEEAGIRFSTAWSAALAGNSAAVEILKSFVTPESPYKEIALSMALRRMVPPAALSWQQDLAKVPETIRLAVISAGIIGDPILVPWLIDQMQIPTLARVAGEAFTMITGVDIELDEMRGARPEGFSAGPGDDPNDDNVAMDADLDLPWPKIESIMRWWDRNNGNFPSAIRYLLGTPVSVDHHWHILKTGLQRQRAAAALELAIMQPGRPLFNVRAPGSRQMEMLGQKGS